MPAAVGLRIASETVSSPFLGYLATLKALRGEIRSALRPVGLERST